MPRKHVLAALASIAEAQQKLSLQIDPQTKTGEIDGHEVAALEQAVAELGKQVMTLRDQAIRAEIANGKRSGDVAKKYGISLPRLSQIAPRPPSNAPKPLPKRRIHRLK